MAASLRLNDDGTCRFTVTTESGVDTIDAEESCTWTADGTAVTVLTGSDDGTATGTFADGTLILTDAETGDVYLFRR